MLIHLSCPPSHNRVYQLISALMYIYTKDIIYNIVLLSNHIYETQDNQNEFISPLVLVEVDCLLDVLALASLKRMLYSTCFGQSLWTWPILSQLCDVPTVKTYGCSAILSDVTRGSIVETTTIVSLRWSRLILLGYWLGFLVLSYVFYHWTIHGLIKYHHFHNSLKDLSKCHTVR